MPKIKLSGLISDIKGKANGSVFARNSGGLYYRNNPSGGGQKTNTWALAKAKLSSLSGKWRNLTADQRIAWNNAVSNYPTVNAFGEPRTPTGYELFMRLNGPLVNLCLPINEIPQNPESFPDLGIVQLATPIDFLFTPEHGYAPFGYNFNSTLSKSPSISECTIDSPPGSNCWTGPSANTLVSIGDIKLNESIIMSALFTLNRESTTNEEGDKEFRLFAFSNMHGAVIAVLELQPSGLYIITAGMTYNPGNLLITSKPFALPLNEPVRLSVFYDPLADSNNHIFVNKDDQTASVVLTDIMPTVVHDTTVNLLPLNAGFPIPYIIQHYSLWNESFDQTFIDAVTSGYLVGSPLLLLDFSYNSEGIF